MTIADEALAPDLSVGDDGVWAGVVGKSDGESGAGCRRGSERYRFSPANRQEMFLRLNLPETGMHAG